VAKTRSPNAPHLIIRIDFILLRRVDKIDYFLNNYNKVSLQRGFTVKYVLFDFEENVIEKSIQTLLALPQRV